MAEEDAPRRAIASVSMTIRASALLAAVATCAGLCACGGTGSSPASASVLSAKADVAKASANPVTVSPLPGTPDASPATQISFLGAGATQVSGVRVVGSRSGAHSGRLEGYSSGTGASFLPAHPFRAGERVRQPEGVSHQPGGPQGRPALQLGALADALDGSNHDAGKARRDRR
jgi:hypothetical protein